MDNLEWPTPSPLLKPEYPHRDAEAISIFNEKGQKLSQVGYTPRDMVNEYRCVWASDDGVMWTYAYGRNVDHLDDAYWEVWGGDVMSSIPRPVPHAG